MNNYLAGLSVDCGCARGKARGIARPPKSLTFHINYYRPWHYIYFAKSHFSPGNIGYLTLKAVDECESSYATHFAFFILYVSIR